jgi:hypothetical protein
VTDYDAPRSTPPEYLDLSVVRDSRGKEWTYSEPGDVWLLVNKDSLTVDHRSARSWQKLRADFGPVVIVHDV